jgi:hypothetical protein
MPIKRAEKKEIVHVHHHYHHEHGILSGVWGTVVWIAGVLVSLAVGFAMVDGTLRIPLLSNFIGGVIIKAAGLVVVILTILGLILKMVDKATWRNHGKME